MNVKSLKLLIIIGLILMWPIWLELYIGITTNNSVVIMTVSVISTSVGIILLIIGFVDYMTGSAYDYRR